MNEPNPDPYASIALATMWVEGIVCTPPEDEPGESSWDLMVKCGVTPDEIISSIKEALTETIAESTQPGRMPVARAQMDLPLFRTYIMGKLGYV